MAVGLVLIRVLGTDSLDAVDAAAGRYVQGGRFRAAAEADVGRNFGCAEVGQLLATRRVDIDAETLQIAHRDEEVSGGVADQAVRAVFGRVVYQSLTERCGAVGV